jgi:hypothetical protein
MAVEEFWQNLRTAAPLLGSPDAPESDPALWLKPRTVDGFDPAEFQFLPADQGQTLEESVRRFRAVAGAVSKKRRPTPEQVREAREALAGVLDLLPTQQFWDAESFRTHVGLNRVLAGQLPKWVTGVTCETGVDHVGDPVMRIWVDVTDKAVDQRKIEKHGRTIRDQMEEAYHAVGGRRMPFIRFRSPDAFARGGAA